MKIGFIISSLTKSIPYMTYLVSLGYEVFPIILKNELWNDFNKNIIEAITNKNVSYNIYLEKNVKLDCLIIMGSLDDIKFLDTFELESVLKQNAPIILNTGNNIENENLLLSSYPNLHIINYNSNTVCENCNEIHKHLEKDFK